MFDDDTTGGARHHGGIAGDGLRPPARGTPSGPDDVLPAQGLCPGAGTTDHVSRPAEPVDGVAAGTGPKSLRGTSRLDGDGPGPDVADDRPLGAALRRGWRRRCPSCGSGPMLRGYLTIRDQCPVCDEGLHHARADDGPAYLTILIVGHLMAPAFLWTFTTYRPEPMVLFTVFAVGCIALSLYLLPRLKGIIVAWQWSRRMHGF